MPRKYIYREGSCDGCGKTINRDNRGRVRKFCDTKCWYDFKCPVGTVRPYEISRPDWYSIIKVPRGTPGSKCSGNRASHWMLEHRYVMQQTLGRALRKGENVHHLNGVKNDNRPENLELWTRVQPQGIRASDHHRHASLFFEGMHAC